MLIQDHKPCDKPYSNPLLALCTNQEEIESKQAEFDAMITFMLEQTQGAEFYCSKIMEALPTILKKDFPLKTEVLKTFITDRNEDQVNDSMKECVKLFRLHQVPDGHKPLTWFKKHTLVTKVKKVDFETDLEV